MKNKKLTANEKGMLVNEQRFSMIVLLCNVLDAEDGVSDAVKSAVAASLLNTIQMSWTIEYIVQSGKMFFKFYNIITYKSNLRFFFM